MEEASGALRPATICRSTTRTFRSGIPANAAGNADASPGSRDR